jgi:hypothetical protein
VLVTQLETGEVSVTGIQGIPVDLSFAWADCA